MAGYWPRVFMDRDEVEVHRHAKENEANIQPSRPHAWSIKDLLYGIKHEKMINFPCGIKPLSRAILPARVANHSARFGSSYDVVKKESDALQGGSWRRGLGSEKL